VIADLRRDQTETGFSPILDGLLEGLPEALCAVFVDPEGEAIDLSSRIDPFESRIVGAELAVALAHCRASCARVRAGQHLELRIEGSARSILSRVVSDGYDLVILLGSSTVSAKASERGARAAVELLREAGLPDPASFVTLAGHDTDLRGAGMLPIARGAVIDDEGAPLRVAAVLGFAQGHARVAALVRCEGGQELLVEQDPQTSRWTRLAV
jgi:hypothetical protein